MRAYTIVTGLEDEKRFLSDDDIVVLIGLKLKGDHVASRSSGDTQ